MTPEKMLIHNDGGSCQGTPLDFEGRCPECDLIPDMQSTAFVDYVSESERQVARVRECLQRWAASDREDDSVETLHEITRIIK